MHKFRYLVIACALATMNVVNADNSPSTEKCYGIAKAGQNDCDNVSTCDKSVIDGDPNYYLNVPTGLCNKIVGGMLMNGQNGTSTMPMAPSTTNTTMPMAPSSAPATTTNGSSMGTGATSNGMKSGTGMGY